MNLKSFFEKGTINRKALEYFNPKTLDPFYSSELFKALYDDEWFSVLICNESIAFLSLFCLKPIGESGYYDIEPFYGYNGPILSSKDELFANKSFDLYCDILKSKNVVAELIRFHPIHQNQNLFHAVDRIKKIASKPLVAIKCLSEQEEIFKEYSTLRRRNIRLAIAKGYEFKILKAKEDWKKFQLLYYSTMDRVNSDSKWYFDDNFFSRNMNSEVIKLFGVFKDGEMISAATFIQHPFLSHYFLAANHEDLHKGASELLIYEASRHLALEGVSMLLLGGGASQDPNDPLLEFKKKFTKNPLYSYTIGGIIINDEIFKVLNNEAELKNPDLVEQKFFLKYRLV